MENLQNSNGSNFLIDIPKPKSFFRTVGFWVVGVMAVIFASFFLFLSAPSGFAPSTIISVDQGTSLRALSFQLKNSHIIRSRIAFEVFVIAYNGEKHIMQGDYLFENKFPVFEIARRIAKGEHHLPPVKVTIPEGFDVSQIASAFTAKLANFDQVKFMAEAKDEEGYLFPDTYFFSLKNNEQDVFIYMRANFDKKILPLMPAIDATGKTEREIITMASLVEREAKGDADREIISGILWNRLKVGMPLQVDAAPATYKTKGLPKNPIANPGLLAIQAAIHPKDSPYLFYLHDSDGIIHYARTFAEHKANKLKYLKP